MPKRSYSPNAKGKILEVAKTIFAEKGFDGSRVDEIAKAANVPKSLIYYHFRSKDAILEELLEDCLKQYKEILATASSEVPASNTEVLLERIRTVYWKFLEEHEDVIRIISMESLKKNSSKASLAFKFIEILTGIEKAHLKSPHFFTEDAQAKHVVTEFFMSQIPVVLFFCLRRAWSEHFNADQDTLARQFLEAYDATYGAYRRQQ